MRQHEARTSTEAGSFWQNGALANTKIVEELSAGGEMIMIVVCPVHYGCAESVTLSRTRVICHDTQSPHDFAGVVDHDVSHGFSC